MIRTSTHKASKRHRCCWCGETIDAKATYKRYSNMSTMYLHPECMSAAEEAVAVCGEEDAPRLAFNQPRGCWCGHTKGCPVCAARSAKEQ